MNTHAHAHSQTRAAHARHAHTARTRRTNTAPTSVSLSLAPATHQAKPTTFSVQFGTHDDGGSVRGGAAAAVGMGVFARWSAERAAM